MDQRVTRPKGVAKNSPRTSTGSSDRSNASFDEICSSFPRLRSNSINQRIASIPYKHGTIKSFSRSKGHGMIVDSQTGEEIFMHVSEVVSEYVPRDGDLVKYKTIPIPPHNTKEQAVDVHFTVEDETREKWNHSSPHNK
ncbi:Cold shock domain-containing protein C2 [Thelohanellus kitauei]|uniref:Cold shock domain-containing protein C2 n=1 Tax=Thelohanellus kitauei TaxID=669202 RepID=A0A0C2J6S8_THEKT|nr:Cold shock domain-containing protein C2 [Thelohanellus kitauei]